MSDREVREVELLVRLRVRIDADDLLWGCDEVARRIPPVDLREDIDLSLMVKDDDHGFLGYRILSAERVR